MPQTVRTGLTGQGRAVAVVAAFAAAAGATLLLGSFKPPTSSTPPASPQGLQTSTTGPTTTPATPPPAPTAPPTVAPTPAPISVPTATGTPVAAAPPPCSPEAARVTLNTDRQSYPQGTSVMVTTTSTNIGVTCLEQATVTIRILGADGRVSATSTASLMPSPWLSGSTHHASYQWNQDDCSTSPCTAAAPGQYRATASWDAQAPMSVAFTVSRV